jgi:hypothetical protein
MVPILAQLLPRQCRGDGPVLLALPLDAITVGVEAAPAAAAGLLMKRQCGLYSLEETGDVGR